MPKQRPYNAFSTNLCPKCKLNKTRFDLCARCTAKERRTELNKKRKKYEFKFKKNNQQEHSSIGTLTSPNKRINYAPASTNPNMLLYYEKEKEAFRKKFNLNKIRIINNETEKTEVIRNGK